MKKEKQAESLQQLILEIALDFINLSPIQVDETINRALQKVGEFTGSDRSYVFQLDRNNDKLRNSHEWYAAGIEPQMERLQSISIKNQSWYRERLLGGKTVFIEDIRKLPEKAKPVKEALLAQGIQSLVVVPMNYSNSQIGFVGFDSVVRKRRWSGAEIELLKVIADIFAHALVHRSLETKLYGSQERYRLLVENLNDGIVISQNDRFIFFNRQFAEMLGYEYEELIMADYRQVYTTEGLKILEERARRRERGEEVPARYETIF
ncbi:MAG TPA: PAS domain S-box protein [Candidatus Marinimicrobia bacterium]|nr:PAS domain S-box protein [Candidatus Neomarinimicrobiota bacterium]